MTPQLDSSLTDASSRVSGAWHVLAIGTLALLLGVSLFEGTLKLVLVDTALLIGLALRSLAMRLERQRGMPRRAALAVTCLIGAGLVASLMVAFGHQLAEHVGEIAGRLPQALEALGRRLDMAFVALESLHEPLQRWMSMDGTNTLLSLWVACGGGLQTHALTMALSATLVGSAALGWREGLQYAFSLRDQRASTTMQTQWPRQAPQAAR